MAFSPALFAAGEAVRPPLVTLPTLVAPGAEVRAAAAKANWSLGPLVLPPEPSAPRLGDGVVALITLSNGPAQKQWLVQFEIDRLTAEDKGKGESMNASVASLSGRKWTFASKPTLALKIRVLGPFATRPYDPKTAAKSAADKTARALINPEWLAIGLDRACRVMLDFGLTELFSSSGLTKPYPTLSEEDDKAVKCGFVPLFQFFVCAQHTPGLTEIVSEIVDRPSLWSMTRTLVSMHINLGFDAGTAPVAAVDPAGWGLPALPLYQYPFGVTLDDKPLVRCAFFVTAPQSPLLATAGIVGFIAESPTHKDKHMLVQIVSAYRGQLPAVSTNGGPP